MTSVSDCMGHDADALRIMLPVFALVGLTFAVLLLIPIARFRAAAAGRVKAGDFSLGESERVPPETRLPNRNYMNLLELPVIFYVACLSMVATHAVDGAAVTIAWIYVGLRFVHSAIHLGYNNVGHRLIVFALSNVVLSVLWIRFAVLLLRA